jgi:chromosomal replication initiator protein
MYCPPCQDHPFEKVAPLNSRSIIEQGCDYLGVNPVRILSRERTRHLVDARYILMHMLRNNPHFSYSMKELARLFKKDDHTSVVHGLKKVKDYYEVDPHFRTKLEGAHYFVYGHHNYLVF